MKKARVSLELDNLTAWPQTFAGLLNLPAHLRACVDTMSAALANGGMYPDVKLAIARDPTRDDVVFFAEHPTRTHRLRATLPNELVLDAPDVWPAQCVVVRQAAPGARFVTAVPDAVIDLSVSPFTDEASRDVFLGLLFDVLCQYPGQMILTDKMIEMARTRTAGAVGAIQ